MAKNKICCEKDVNELQKKTKQTKQKNKNKMDL